MWKGTEFFQQRAGPLRKYPFGWGRTPVRTPVPQQRPQGLPGRNKQLSAATIGTAGALAARSELLSAGSNVGTRTFTPLHSHALGVQSGSPLWKPFAIAAGASVPALSGPSSFKEWRLGTLPTFLERSSRTAGLPAISDRLTLPCVHGLAPPAGAAAVPGLAVASPSRSSCS